MAVALVLFRRRHRKVKSLRVPSGGVRVSLGCSEPSRDGSGRVELGYTGDDSGLAAGEALQPRAGNFLWDALS